MNWLEWLTPWEFSPTLIVTFVICGVLFWRGSRVHAVQKSRQWLFWIGFIALYLNLHTLVDYYSERMFFIHRIQHLFLHHLLPLIILCLINIHLIILRLIIYVRIFLCLN